MMPLNTGAKQVWKTLNLEKAEYLIDGESFKGNNLRGSFHSLEDSKPAVQTGRDEAADEHEEAARPPGVVGRKWAAFYCELTT